jgi:beta-N-acetylhexosaminidase
VLPVLRNEANLLPFRANNKIAYVGIGTASINTFGQRLSQDMNADTFAFSYKDDSAKMNSLLQQIRSNKYDAVIIGVHDFSFRLANNYNISKDALALWNALQSEKAITFLFGNVYAAKNFCNARTLVAMHQDDAAFSACSSGFPERFFYGFG